MTALVILATFAVVGVVMYASWRWWMGRIPEPEPEVIHLNRQERRALSKMTSTRQERMATKRAKHLDEIQRYRQRGAMAALRKQWDQQRKVDR